mgnify:CR=1 FL=1
MQLLAQYFYLLVIMNVRKYLLVPFIFISFCTSAQKIENIFVNLYTDSLKKGTFNYINIDGLLSNGKYMPLDSTEIIFWASDGKFTGNNLWIDKNFDKEKVFIKVVLKHNPSISKEFTMWIKQKPDNEKLKTSEELINEMENAAKKRKRKN